MSSTVPVALSVNNWVDISQGQPYGFFTNGADRYITFVTAFSLPPPTQKRGHRLNPGENMQFSLQNGEAVYARATFNSLPNLAYVTGGYDTFYNGGANSKDFLTEVRKGNVPGHRTILKRGRNPEVDKNDFEEVRWLGGLRVPLQTAVQMRAFSDDNDDTDLTGSNAWKIEIFGFDANYNEISEVMSLNGISGSAPTTQLFIGVHLILPIENGSFNVRNAGEITIRDVPGNDDQILMPQETGFSKDSHYTIPAGKTGHILRVTLEAAVKVNKEVDFRLMGRLNTLGPTPPYPPTAEIHVWNAVAGVNQIDITSGLKFEELTDIWFECFTEVEDTNAGVSYEVLLVDN